MISYRDAGYDASLSATPGHIDLIHLSSRLSPGLGSSAVDLHSCSISFAASLPPGSPHATAASVYRSCVFIHTAIRSASSQRSLSMRGIMLNTADGMSYTSTSGRPNALNDPRHDLSLNERMNGCDRWNGEYILPSGSPSPGSSSPGSTPGRFFPYSATTGWPYPSFISRYERRPVSMSAAARLSMSYGSGGSVQISLTTTPSSVTKPSNSRVTASR